MEVKHNPTTEALDLWLSQIVSHMGFTARLEFVMRILPK
jgi:hypothetical protein